MKDPCKKIAAITQELRKLNTQRHKFGHENSLRIAAYYHNRIKKHTTHAA